MQTDPWDLIFEKLNIYQNNFNEKPFFITADDIKGQLKFLRKQENESQEFSANKIAEKIDLRFLRI